jgi:4-diphosphocytidyl-2-C-methyl-D-erythritol kinase
MQEIDLHDVITISKAPHGIIEVSVDSPVIPSGPGNLAYKAAVLLKEVSRHDLGVNIDIKKNVPAQAGLGGGSSNAAATLVGINKLLDLDLAQDQLVELAAELGSDVPFFLTGGTMLAKAGERN